jgi:mRNA-degrading endonuclease toxin of MazEF toxin-antitoxin module
VRGDVHLLGAPRDVRGDEQRGHRYAVGLQSDYLAELSTCLVAPTSASVLPLSFRPRLEVEGAADAAAVASWRRPTRPGSGPAGRLTTDELAEADAALRIVLGLR